MVLAYVANISVDEFKGKFFKKIDYSYSDISGFEILNIKIKSQKCKKKLDKILSKNGIKYIVSDNCDGVANTDGQALLKNIYPIIVKRFAKTYKKSDSVLVCADRLDSIAKETILMLCDHFKYISVVTSDYNKDKFFDEVFSEKGVTILPPSENVNEPVFYISGNKPQRKNIFDMSSGKSIKIYTSDKKIITSALCEAVIKAKSGENCDLKTEFLSLKFKVI